MDRSRRNGGRKKGGKRPALAPAPALRDKPIGREKGRKGEREGAPIVFLPSSLPIGCAKI
jgi:hypothetical protein